MMQQKGQPQYTAFRNAGKRMNIVQTECQNGAAQQGKHGASDREIGKTLGKRQNKTTFLNILKKSIIV